MLKKVIISLIIIICIPLLIIGGSYLYVNSTEYSMYYQEGIDEVPVSDVIVVPGGAVSLEGPSLYIQHRLDTAVTLYQKGKADKILVSGSKESTYLFEAEIMYQYLIKQSIPSDAIYVDNYGYDTHATLHRANDYFDHPKMIICTQEIYMPRTMFLAKSEKVDAVGVSSDIVIYTSKILQNKLRETVAYTKALYDSVLHPEERNLEQCPIRKGEK